MDMAIIVTCVSKGDPHLDGCECITEIGWKNNLSGETGTSSPREIYDYLKDGNDMYVEYKGDRAELIPVDGDTKKHVRTEPGTPEKNLLDQPAC